MSSQLPLHYVSDAAGNAVAVIIPIDIWHEIESERETACLLKSNAMKARLQEALARTGGATLEEARATLGI